MFVVYCGHCGISSTALVSMDGTEGRDTDNEMTYHHVHLDPDPSQKTPTCGLRGLQAADEQDHLLAS